MWNCRGAASKKFLRTLKELLRTHKPCMLVLMETRCNGLRATEILQHTLFSNVEVVETQGFAGGIWLFWRHDLVEVEILTRHFQFINAIIRRRNEVDWVFTATYASPNPSLREQLWDYVTKLGSVISIP